MVKMNAMHVNEHGPETAQLSMALLLEYPDQRDYLFHSRGINGDIFLGLFISASLKFCILIASPYTVSFTVPMSSAL